MYRRGVQHLRTQRSVGQGFFHTALVAADRTAAATAANKSVHYVYDCGATRHYGKALDREVAGYRAEVGGGTLDLLFLSHMHDDHVTGVPKLLKPSGNGPKLDTVVMPFVDARERLIAFAAALARKSLARSIPSTERSSSTR